MIDLTKAKYTYNPEHFAALLKSVQACVAKTQKEALSHLEKKVLPYITAKVENTAGADKKLFETSHNLVTSYIDGLKGGDVEVKELRTLRKDMEKVQSAHEKKLAEAMSREEAKKSAEEAGGITITKDGKSVRVGDPEPNEPEWFGDYMKGKGEHDPGEEAPRIFRKYAKFKREMPVSLGKKPYLAVRMPILVIPTGIPDMLKLQRTGLCDDFLFGYPILQKQVIVGINQSWVMEHFGETKKKDKSLLDPAKTTQRDMKLDFESAVGQIIREIKQRTGRSYIQMGETHGFNSNDIHWAWIASDMDLRRLQGTAGPGTFSIKDWTLPFEQQIKKLKPRSK